MFEMPVTSPRVCSLWVIHFKHCLTSVLRVYAAMSCHKTMMRWQNKIREAANYWESSLSAVCQRDSGAWLVHYIQKEGAEFPGYHCNQGLYSRRCRWLAHCQPKLIGRIFQCRLQSECYRQPLSPPWHIAAHPCLSVCINLSGRPIQKWRSLLPLLSAFAFVLMQEEMNCCRENGDWICPHIHPPPPLGARRIVSSSTTVPYCA